MTGIFFDLSAPRYIDLLISKFPIPYDANNVKIIGKKSSTLDVVSSIITAKEYVILVEPDNTAVAPRIAIVSAVIVSAVSPKIAM